MNTETNLLLLGRNLRLSRKSMQMTMKQFSELCEISERYLANIERGQGAPALETLVRIANRAEVSLDYLLRDSLTVFENRTPPIEDTLITFPPEQQEILRDFIKRLAATMQ